MKSHKWEKNLTIATIQRTEILKPIISLWNEDKKEYDEKWKIQKNNGGSRDKWEIDKRLKRTLDGAHNLINK